MVRGSIVANDLSMRFFPHVSDTGGFFVAVLEKVGPIVWPNQENLEEGKDEEEEQQQEGAGEDEVREMVINEEIVRKKRSKPLQTDTKPKRKHRLEEPFLPLSEELATTMMQLK